MTNTSSNPISRTQAQELACALIRNSSGIRTNSMDLQIHFQNRYGIQIDWHEISIVLDMMRTNGEIKQHHIDQSGLTWYDL